MLKKKVGKQGTWPGAFTLLFLPIIVFLSIRWLYREPFVIPSGSMEPTLFEHDHILVDKSSFGIRMPFGNDWIFTFSQPKRGDVIVFKYPENPNVYYIKRVIGVPGDKLVLRGAFITANGVDWPTTGFEADSIIDPNFENFDYFIEYIFDGEKGKPTDSPNHMIKTSKNGPRDPGTREIEVPKDSFFVMGDNRDESYDSRFWGFVPFKNVVGKPTRIWLSCESTLASMPMICDPQKLRLNRLFTEVQP